jgi:hypothetical protein
MSELLSNSRKTGPARPPEFLTLYWRHAVPFALLSKLNPRKFVRIHRSTIVNLNFVKEVQPWFHGYHLVVLESGHQLRMSRYQQEVAERLGLSGKPS